MELMFGSFLYYLPDIAADDPNDQALSHRFAEMGVRSTNVILMFGGQALVLASYLVMAVICRGYAKRCLHGGRVVRARFCRILCMEWFLRTLSLLYLPLAFYTLIGLSYKEGTPKLVAYVYLTSILLIPLLIAFCGHKEARLFV